VNFSARTKKHNNARLLIAPTTYNNDGLGGGSAVVEINPYDALIMLYSAGMINSALVALLNI